MTTYTPTDLAPIDVTDVVCDGRRLRVRRPPLRMVPRVDDSRQLLLLAAPDISLRLCAATREELVEMIPEFICDLWIWYALPLDDELTDRAKRLKASLVQTFEELA